MGRIDRYSVPLTLERLETEDMGEGVGYADPVSIMAVYDPVSSDLGPDNPQRRSATVVTYTELTTGDRITEPEKDPEEDGQIVTQVSVASPPEGPLYQAIL